jgi:hypothetical protein
MLLAGLGSGVALGAGTGLVKLLKPRRLPYTRGSALQHVQIPIAKRVPEEEEETEKVAGITEIRDRLGKFILNAIGDVTPTEFMKGEGRMRGSGATSVWGHPLVAGVGFPASFLLGYGTYKGIDALTENMQQAEQEEELAEAKKRYQKVLAENIKMSADDELELLAQLRVKEADSTKKADAVRPKIKEPLMVDTAEINRPSSTGESIADKVGLLPAYRAVDRGLAQMGGMTTGAYMGAAALVAAITAHLAYRRFKKRMDRSVVDEALGARAQQRAGTVPPVYLEPVEV